VVCEPDGNLQQAIIPGCPVEGNRRLEEVACTVKLMTKVHIGPFPGGFDHLIIAVQDASGAAQPGSAKHIVRHPLQLAIRRLPSSQASASTTYHIFAAVTSPG
jgi:hypothetical protein